MAKKIENEMKTGMIGFIGVILGLYDIWSKVSLFRGFRVLGCLGFRVLGFGV